MDMAASVAGLISLADLTFRVVYKYVRCAIDAEKDVKNLKREIEGLCSVLRTLQALTDILITEEEKDKSALSIDILDQCRETLEEISNKLRGAFLSFEQKNNIIKATFQRLKWPFSATETKEILNVLSRYKLTLSMATSADSLSKLRILLNNQVEHNIKIEEAVRNIDGSTKLIANIVLDKERRRILHFFMDTTLNPRQNLDQSIKLREPTTGTWLMASIELQSWLSTSGSLLWFNGIPGGGKTILAGLVIQQAMTRNSDEVGVAFFFCDYKNTATLRLANILGAIAVQLALQNDASYEILEKYHKDLNPPNKLAAILDVDGLERVIGSMIKTFSQVLIVIDGLDECGDEMGIVTKSLADFATLDTPASVALFSRQEPEIRARMGNNFTEIPIEAHTEDIKIYVRAELEKRIQSRRLRLSDPETADKIEEELVRRADGIRKFLEKQQELASELPFYPQAAAYWPMLLRASPENSRQPLLQQATESLFGEYFSPELRTWIYWFLATLCEIADEGCSKTECLFAANIALDKNVEPLHLAAALNMPQLCLRLMEDGDSPYSFSDHLQDRRVSVFDSWSWDGSPSQTLLHHATSRNAIKCVDLLLRRECDPYARNQKGVPALHEIDITKNGGIIDTFLAHGISLLGTDTNQRTLWHVCAYGGISSADFMLKLFTAKPEETRIAVFMKDDDGCTPLLLALSNDPSRKINFEELEDNALSFIKHCSDVSGFWGKHDPILHQAFAFGSEKVMRRLFDLGIKPDPFIAGTLTPLHKLSVNTSPEWLWRDNITLGALRAHEEAVGECGTERGRNILKSLLKHSDHRKLKEFDIDRRGLGLLHKIASTGQEPHMRWLMEELVSRGVDVNGFDRDSDETIRMTPLIYHIRMNSDKRLTF
ncbi:hypothetical protein FGSG_08215 [Fusarium graminearum PH-1]|uniref:hypothetical protein n=1 Tax=Gibberella zeae (strain ATCC MYA-4620 / CBS 123657 / FGSC 9075 / NRRL 31084 / PH-1) TaxID=229533 RepID=UPI00021F2074|nr:hypothetical protein FGSG_08215 [Fusarium graminearum PH-1]ESU15167.1 hypothetical protein FGSG_08215 [Fusarium graminearum PH-1]|eukprot:XP_011320592.1 hypothetical protein FGSG_08215 [Fusarium graminearum PH-1]